MSIRIDLHMHSAYSDDGESSPSELVALCASAGIGTMAVTDHNSVRAVPEAMRAASLAGLVCIPGIEIDCSFLGDDLHVLGYGIDFESDDFARIERNVAEQGPRASLRMLESTRALGFELSEADLAGIAAGRRSRDTWTGEMFAEVLLGDRRYLDHPLLAPYRKGGARGDNPLVNFYWDYYSKGRPCHAAVSYPSLEDVVAIIHRNGGVAILAHPGAYSVPYRGRLDSLIAAGLDGVEAFSSYHTPSQAFGFLREAEAAGALVTCGSDFHGKTKPEVRIGRHGCLLPEEQVLGGLRDAIARRSWT